MKRLLLCALLSVTAIAGCTHGEFHVENDIFANRKTDQYFTHGTQFSNVIETDKEREVYSLSQTIYTPSRKREDADPAVLKNDRPYTGFLAVEYRNTKLTSETQKDTYGIQLGCSGPCSFAKQTQRGFHGLIGQDKPTWDRDYTLKSEPGAILEAERSYLLAQNDYSDISTYGALKAGNIIDSAAFGFDGRLGFNLPAFSDEPIIFKKLQSLPLPYRAYLFSRVEERLVPYNHFLDGSLFQDERHTVDSELSVQEFDAGLTFGYDQFFITYRYTIFSNEWKEKQGSFAFGGITLGW